jgi:thiosulfate/3-mercaptopyruvate sulfurtransferase
MHTTLITPDTLRAHIGQPDWLIIDCRFDLANTGWGEQQYLAGHIPGAIYAHLDRDLSGTKTGVNGRHPLPSHDDMIQRFGGMGIGPSTQVVVYDADSGMHASRLWWMLRYMGHDAAALLDRGWARWTREVGISEPGRVVPKAAAFNASPREDWRLSADQVRRDLGSPQRLLVDARSNERFRGQGETLDPVAGHIPGAASAFFQNNLNPDKTFKSPDELRAQWTATLAGHDPKEVVCYCGSGVTACHNLLAMEVAGLGGARIFPGSWSEWCADPSRPVER